MKDDLPGPKFVQLFSPVLSALKTLGGSARPAEVIEQIAKELKLPEAERSELLDSGTPKFDNLVAWARFYLAKAGYIDASKRGVWTLTDRGRAANAFKHSEALAIFKQQHGKFMAGRSSSAKSEAEEDAPSPRQEDSSVVSYRQSALEILQALPPDGFERFCQRLLRESGFQEVTITGRSGDGGIDGIGILQVNPLVSFKVLFQCKRYKGTVVPAQVRDFRGAMMGRADKGIILSTGTFSVEARKEAVRDGVPPIELVDGEKLIDMVEELELGLKPVQSFTVDMGFFEDFGFKAS